MSNLRFVRPVRRPDISEQAEVKLASEEAKSSGLFDELMRERERKGIAMRRCFLGGVVVGLVMAGVIVAALLR